MDILLRFTSKERTIVRSTQHKDLWIVSFPDGGFYTISSSQETIQITNPPDYKVYIAERKF